MLLRSGTHTSLGEVGDAEPTHDKGKHSKSEKSDQIKDPPISHCEGCNRDNHKREDCKFRTHPDFNDRRAHHAKSIPTSEVGLAGTQLSHSIYGTVVFDLTLFNEVTKSDNILKRIEAIVIDSCIEVIAKVRRKPAAVEQMKIVIDEDKWRLP
jgi:hypothetical protein